MEVQRGQVNDLKSSSLEVPSLRLEFLPVAQENNVDQGGHAPLAPYFFRI